MQSKLWGMFVITFLCVFFFFTISPMGLSFLVTSMSFFFGLLLMKEGMPTFLGAIIMLSFSSGMMILFSYCSILTTHENSSKGHFFISLFPLFFFFSALEEHSMDQLSCVLTLSGFQFQSLLMSMLLVILVMFCINFSLLSPKKSSLSVY